jgi:hypothetical protein
MPGWSIWMSSGGSEDRRLRKHWSKRLRDQIREGERHNEVLASAARSATEQAKVSAVKWREEERLRLQAEADLQEVRAALFRKETENHLLQNRLREHAALLEELNTTRDELKSARQKILQLEKELNRRTGREGHFGLSTPSSRKPNKPGSTDADRMKKGGARKGHRGRGRKAFTEQDAEAVEKIDEAPLPCRCGNGTWHLGSVSKHCVIERIPEKRIRKFYLKQEYVCARCGRTHCAATPGVVQAGLYGNTLVSHALTEHYLHGLTAGSVCRREKIGEGTFFGMASRCARLLEPVFKRIVLMLRDCLFVHADETGWRNDGRNAYGWLFANHGISVFLFRNTRGGIVPREVFGEDPLDVNLVTDRYGGYNSLKLCRQYCYTHLLRDLKTLEKEFPDEPEVKAFASELKPLLKEAITMYGKKMDLVEYTAAAIDIKDRIISACAKEANHPGIQHFQNIFREHPNRLFQWTKSPEIPAENNFAERGLRPSVIARKISFGSQSDRGMQTREILMTILHTARARGADPENTLKKILDILCQNPDADVMPLLGFGVDTRHQAQKSAA